MHIEMCTHTCGHCKCSSTYDHPRHCCEQVSAVRTAATMATVKKSPQQQIKKQQTRAIIATIDVSQTPEGSCAPSDPRDLSLPSPRRTLNINLVPLRRTYCKKRPLPGACTRLQWTLILVGRSGRSEVSRSTVTTCCCLPEYSSSWQLKLSLALLLLLLLLLLLPPLLRRRLL